MDTSTNPNGISNGVSSDNLYIKFQKGISQHETGKVIHPKCYKNSNEFLFLGRTAMTIFAYLKAKVIREKSRGEGSLIEQDTIENVSKPNFF